MKKHIDIDFEHMRKESKHLRFIYERMINVHGEDKDYDYMQKFNEIIQHVADSEESFINYLKIVNKRRDEENMKTKFKFKDNNNKSLKNGDKVEFLTIIDDSDTAVNIFGVEPQLDGWVEQVYLEKKQGEIVFNKDNLMFQIKSGNRFYPLSTNVRFLLASQNWERLDESHIKEFCEDNNLESLNPEILVDYLIKI